MYFVHKKKLFLHLFLSHILFWKSCKFILIQSVRVWSSYMYFSVYGTSTFTFSVSLLTKNMQGARRWVDFVFCLQNCLIKKSSCTILRVEGGWSLLDRGRVPPPKIWKFSMAGGQLLFLWWRLNNLVCRLADKDRGKCFGGVARLATAVNSTTHVCQFRPTWNSLNVKPCRF